MKAMEVNKTELEMTGSFWEDKVQNIVQPRQKAG